MRARRRRLVTAVIALAATAAVAGLVASSAPAVTFGAEEITSFASDITIEPSGDLRVVETIVYDFGTLERHGIFRDIPVRVDYPPKAGYDRIFPTDVVSVRGSPGTPVEYTEEESGDNLRIKIGDPDRTISGVHTYTITYRMRGALNGFPDHAELVWNVNGTQWPVFILDTTAVVHAPGAVQQVACTAGPYGSQLPCGSAAHEGQTATFHSARLGPFANMTVAVAFPKDAVATTAPVLDERFSFTSAFRVTPATGGLALGLLVVLLGGVTVLTWLVGRDRRVRGSAVDVAFADGNGPDERVPLFEHSETPVEFAPPDGLRPGQIGTLVDFRADALDVTATIVDLAVRGYLTIEDGPDSGRRKLSDWTLTRRRDADDGLLPYEEALLAALFRSGDVVRVSDLRYHFADRLRSVQQSLRVDAEQRGWFAKHSGAQRVSFVLGGALLVLAGIALGVVLALETHAALVAIPLVVGGIALVVASHFVPRRTARGHGVLRRVDGFRRFIDESEKHRARFAEQKNLFSEYLPYAIVFGVTKKWANAFAGLDGEPPDTSSWYPGAHVFDAVLLSDAIDGFAVTTAGTLSSVPPSTSGSSGFSGGGFSGGGAGGGGGGSW